MMGHVLVPFYMLMTQVERTSQLTSVVCCCYIQWGNAGLRRINCKQRWLTFPHSLRINAWSIAVDSLRVHLISDVYIKWTS